MLTYQQQLPLEEDLEQMRMYVLVRRDILPLVHCAVQAAHSVAEFVHYHPNNNTKVWVTCEKTLIVLEATEDQINEKMKWFADRNMNYQPFWEPDMGNCMTAVAFQPITKSLGKEVFGNLKLLG
jgi:hypothetical protein